MARGFTIIVIKASTIATSKIILLVLFWLSGKLYDTALFAGIEWRNKVKGFVSFR